MTHPNITMKPIKSSQIESIGHDPATNTLAVKFKSGGTYHYSGIDAAKFEDMNNAESVGKYLHKNIKGVHPYKKLP